MRPSLPDRSRQPAPSVKTPQEKSVHLPSVSSTSPALLGATAHSQHLYNQLLPHSFLCNRGVPFSSSLALCFQQLPHSYCFPMLFPHTRGLYLYKSLRTAPAPTLSGRLCAIFFRFFHESETAGTNHQPLLCPHSFLPFSTLNLRSEIQILSELLTSFSAPSCNSRRMNTCKSGSK